MPHLENASAPRISAWETGPADRCPWLPVPRTASVNSREQVCRLQPQTPGTTDTSSSGMSGPSHLLCRFCLFPEAECGGFNFCFLLGWLWLQESCCFLAVCSKCQREGRRIVSKGLVCSAVPMAHLGHETRSSRNTFISEENLASSSPSVSSRAERERRWPLLVLLDSMGFFAVFTSSLNILSCWFLKFLQHSFHYFLN